MQRLLDVAREESGWATRWWWLSTIWFVSFVQHAFRSAVFFALIFVLQLSLSQIHPPESEQAFIEPVPFD